MTGPVSPTGPPTTAGHSVLVVPIPALETLVAARHAHYDRDYVSADPTFAHAHVTTLGPWLTQADLADPVRANAALTAVRDIASATRGFDIDFAHVDTFPNGIIHLVPEPAEPFAALTAAVASSRHTPRMPVSSAWCSRTSRSTPWARESPKPSFEGGSPTCCRCGCAPIDCTCPGTKRAGVRPWQCSRSGADRTRRAGLPTRQSRVSLR
jgi:hypothetical protein